MLFDLFINRLFPEKLTRDKYYRSLIRNMVLTIIIVSMIPMVLVSSTLYLQFRHSYREKVNDHLRELVLKHKQNIDNYLQERLTDIRLMTARYGYDRLKEGDLLQQNLDLLKEEYEKAFVDLGVIDEQGHQKAYVGPFRLADAFYGDAEWFKDVSQKDHVISDVFLGLRGLPHFIVAVRSEMNGRPWILRATIDFVAFNALVQNIRIGETGFAYILNRQGKLQTTPFSQSFKPAVIDTGAPQELWQRMPSEDSDVQVFLRKDRTGQDYIYAEAPLKNGEWLLVYQQRASDAFADLNWSFAVTTLIMALGAAAVIIMALALSRRMVMRIAKADEEKHLMDEKVVETGKLASIGELASGVAHEINNPVAIMVEEAGWIGDLLEETEFQESKNIEELRRSLAQIKTQGKRCKEITRKLLSFARKTSLSVQDIQINELIEELVGISAQRAKYGMVEIAARLQENLPTLRVSLSELQQVILNLINNALDAMEKKGGKLTLSTRLQGGFVAVDVSDTGVGIPAANLNRIFDPFFTTKAVGKGTGLGLSICYGIIENMGGRIEVQSTVDVGTTISVYIPVPVNEPSENPSRREDGIAEPKKESGDELSQNTVGG
jgi:two-component system NtrC family sensor kinase